MNAGYHALMMRMARTERYSHEDQIKVMPLYIDDLATVAHG